MADAVGAAGLDGSEVRRIVERHFRVYDAREEKVRGEVAARLYYLMFPPSEFDARFAAVREELRALDPELLVFVRREAGEDILFVADRPPAAQHRTGLHVGLLLATLVTTVLSGAVTWHGYMARGGDLSWSVLWNGSDLLWGALTFALPLMAILGLHELAHFLVARRHGLRASLPFFIPAPPVLVPFGTLGAFISMRDPMPDRKALFDVGAAGPLVGFLVTLPVIILGAFLTGAVAQPLPDTGHPLVAADLPFTLTREGTPATLNANVTAGARFLTFNVTPPPQAKGDWAYTATATVHLADGTQQADTSTRTLAAGHTERRSVALPLGTRSVDVALTWDDGLLHLGDPLLVQLLGRAFHNDGYLTHPTFLAGWVGLLVTGINLLPAGQLDGGHVARAVLGERMRYVALAAIGLLMVLAFLFNSWLLMAFFLLVTGVQHAPPLNDRTVLDRKRLVLAAVVLAVFVLTFVPVPIQVGP
jgi:membrane-associated protease RseP (regulator of RpoE activity)